MESSSLSQVVFTGLLYICLCVCVYVWCGCIRCSKLGGNSGEISNKQIKKDKSLIHVPLLPSSEKRRVRERIAWFGLVLLV